VFQPGLKPANRASNHAAGGDDPPRSADSWRLLAKVSFNPLYVVRGPSQAKLSPRRAIFIRRKPASARDLGLVVPIGKTFPDAKARPAVSSELRKPMRQNALQRSPATEAQPIRSVRPLVQKQPIQSTQFGQKWGSRTGDWVNGTRTLEARGTTRLLSVGTPGRWAASTKQISLTPIGARWRAAPHHRAALETRCEPQRLSFTSEQRRPARAIGGCGRSTAPYNHGSTNF
jgi:hypothetical protein